MTRCFIERSIPIRSKIPESIIYFSLFGRNPVFISESLEYLTMIKHETIPVMIKVSDKLSEGDNMLDLITASKQLQELNDLNVLVKDSLAILSTDKHLLVRGESIFRYVLIIGILSNLFSMGVLCTMYMLRLFSYNFWLAPWPKKHIL